MRISPLGRCAGFTLFELLVVLFLMAAVAAVVLPSFSGGLGGIELETAARDLVTHLRQARTEAVSQQQVYRLIFRSQEGPDQPYSYAITDEYEQVIKEFPLPKKVRISAEEELPFMISFYPNGRSSGGTVRLTHEKGRTMTVTVNPITGFGRVVEASEGPGL